MMKPQPIPRAVLFLRTVVRFVAGIVLIAGLVFIPAGTLHFWQAWVYMALIFVPMAIFGVVLFAKDPDLLERRMRMRETQAEQRKAIAGLSILLFAMLMVPGFDRRYGWSMAPSGLVLLADFFVLLGYALFVLTIRENRYASRVVELQQDQVVVSSGPYAIVRHPMYLGTGLMFTLSPLALGSYWGLIPAVLFPIVLAARINNEEQLLRASLKGYDEYTRKVKYRLVPFVW